MDANANTGVDANASAGVGVGADADAGNSKKQKQKFYQKNTDMFFTECINAFPTLLNMPVLKYVIVGKGFIPSVFENFNKYTIKGRTILLVQPFIVGAICELCLHYLTHKASTTIKTGDS